MKLFATLRFISFLSLLVFAVAGTRAQTATPTPSRTPVIAEEDQVVKVESRLVVVPVSVTDSNGEAVKGLKATDFRISEENRPQIIDSLGNAENVPLEIALLIDVSGSVNPL